MTKTVKPGAQFVQDLIDDPGLREEFRRDPATTAETRGVPPKVVDSLLSVEWDDDIVERLSKAAVGCCSMHG